jgi:uncharacterized protein YeaO (DUF488 family)
VDRLWPRGLSKSRADIDDWLRDISPSTELRKWYGHDPSKWPEFRQKYFAELKTNSDAVQTLLDHVRSGTVTLVFSSKEEQLNNATALKEYLEVCEQT